MTNNLKGFWSDKNDTTPKHSKFTKPVKQHKPANKKKRGRRNKVKYESSGDDFYKSKEWRQIRYLVIRKYGGGCMACGRSKKDHGIVIHVDHIKPRSKMPQLALCFDNLQLLCEDCNLGKSNTDRTDWRPICTDYEEALDAQMLNDPNSIYAN